MDLRWHLHHVTGTITRAFGLKLPPGETQLWLFHGAPSSTSEEPLNAHTTRSEQTTLRDLQCSAPYVATPAKKPLSLHAVQLPIQPERTHCLVCARFFDDAVREVGSCVISVPAAGTIQDVLTEAKKHLQPEWGITGPLRVLEIIDCRLHKHHRPETRLATVSCASRGNLFYHCLRIEADPELAGADNKLAEIFHCDRQSQQAFAQPLLLALAPGEKSGSIKTRCKTKLRVPDSEFKSWRLVRCGRTGKVHLKDDESWDSDAVSLPDGDGAGKLCLEHVHPNPANSLARQSRYNKPLTIKG